MRFLRAGGFYFNDGIFSYTMALLIIFLSKIRTNFIYVNITHIYFYNIYQISWANTIATLDFLR